LSIAAESGTGLGVRFDELAAEHRDRPAIVCDGVERTWGDLVDHADRLARHFADLGVGPGKLVTIALPNSIEFYEVAIAVWKLGAVPQPVSNRLAGPELAAILEVADPALVVGLESPDGRPSMVAVDAGSLPSPSSSLPPRISPSWKAPTSGGSTGRPKVILATTPGVAEEITMSAPILRIEKGDVFLCTAPLSHNAPFGFSMIALLLGGTVILMPRFDAGGALELAERFGVTWMYLVPTMMQRILRLGDARLKYNLDTVRVFYHLAAPCPPHVKEAWIDWIGPDRLIELYAGTEALATTVITGREWLEHRGSVGRVVAGEMSIRDGSGQPLPSGELGEVWMRTQGGVKTYEYLGAVARERDGWESLGDLGSMDSEGYLYLADRMTDMVLVGGANVYPAEIEAALAEHPEVLSACVIGLPDPDMGSSLHAIVELAHDIGDAELLGFLRDRLSSYKIPKSIERSATPLRDDAGKMRRSALREERLDGRSAIL
jgi:bile acid-coenzyme A ligase